MSKKLAFLRRKPATPPLDATSVLNALTGSMEAARLAGMIPATNAANARIKIAPVITLKFALVIS